MLSDFHKYKMEGSLLPWILKQRCSFLQLPPQCPSLDAEPDPTRLSRFPIVVPYSKKGRKRCREEAFSKDGFVSLSIPSEISTLYYQANLVPKGMLVSVTILFSNKKQLKQMGRGGLEPCRLLGCWPARPSIPKLLSTPDSESALQVSVAISEKTGPWLCSAPGTTTYAQSMDQWWHHPQAQQCSCALRWRCLSHSDLKAQLLDLLTWKTREENHFCNIVLGSLIQRQDSMSESSHLLGPLLHMTEFFQPRGLRIFEEAKNGPVESQS